MLVILKYWLFLNLLYLKCFCSNVFRLAFWHTYVYIYTLGPGLGAGPHWEHRPHLVPELDLVWASFSFCGPAVAPECVARVISGDEFGTWWMHGAPRGSAATLSYMVRVPWGLAGASNPRPCVSQARTYIDMHDFQMRGHISERWGTPRHAHVLVMMFCQ